MKKIVLAISIFLFLAGFNISYAQNILPRDNSKPIATKSATGTAIKAQTDAQRLEDLKKRAQTEIDRRINALNKLITRIGSMRRLSDVDLSSLTEQIQTEIDGLTALKSEIEQETDLTALREKVKSIVTDYYIFAFFIQYINISAALDRAATTQTNVSAVVDKLSARIGQAENAGKDVTQLKSLLGQIQTKLSELNTLIVSTQDEITGLDSDGFPANKTTLQDGRSKLKTIHTSFREIHSLAKQIIQLLRPGDKSMSPSDLRKPAATTVTSTLTPTSSPTPTP